MFEGFDMKLKLNDCTPRTIIMHIEMIKSQNTYEVMNHIAI